MDLVLRARSPRSSRSASRGAQSPATASPAPPASVPRRLEGAHLIELRELRASGSALRRSPRLEIHPYLDGLPLSLHTLNPGARAGLSTRAVFVGRAARAQAAAAVDALLLTQLALAREAATDAAALERYEALAAALLELNQYPH